MGEGGEYGRNIDLEPKVRRNIARKYQEGCRTKRKTHEALKKRARSFKLVKQPVKKEKKKKKRNGWGKNKCNKKLKYNLFMSKKDRRLYNVRYLHPDMCCSSRHDMFAFFYRTPSMHILLTP